MSVRLARTKRVHMICPYLKGTIMPLCQVKKGSLTVPNVHELEYYCLTFRYKECPAYKKHHLEGEPVLYSGHERRKHERFKAAIPVNVGLINLKREKTIEAHFWGVTTDISIEGLRLELKYPEAGMFPFGMRIMGEEREFDLEVTVKVGQESVRGVGEVRWASIPSPSVMRMGVFLKEIIEGETGKWRDFVMSRGKRIPGVTQELKE